MATTGRLHGKMVPLPPGKTENCPHCLRAYVKYYLESENDETSVKLCPYCRNVLPEKPPKAIEKRSSDIKTVAPKKVETPKTKTVSKKETLTEKIMQLIPSSANDKKK
jgi:hypothetical protein